MAENVESTALAPPFEIHLFHQPAISRSKVVLKETPVDVENEDLNIQLKGSGASEIIVGADNSLSLDGKRHVIFYPWDIVQIVTLVLDPDRFISLVLGEGSRVVLREPKRLSSFATKNKKGEKKMKVPNHIYALITDENKSAYMSAITFNPDDSFEESYIPRYGSGIKIIEICDDILRVWSVCLTVSQSVTYLRVEHKEIARPMEFQIGQTDDMLRFVNDNSHLFL